MSINNTFIDSLVSAGSDAYSNLYIAKFTFGSGSPNVGENTDTQNIKYSVRCTEFSIPTEKQESYETKFVTASVPKPLTKITLDRKTTIKFRVDANYEIYTALLKQQNVTSNMAKSFVTNDIKALKDAGKLFELSVDVLDSAMTGITNEDATEFYRFHDCWITKIDSLPFGEAKELEVSVDISFLTMDDPVTLGLVK